MELPDLKLLQAAIVLSEVRHYSRAAKRLGIQQPTLTKRIVELEHFVGFRLFMRSTQYVEPTDSCLQLVQEAKDVVFHAERAIQVARTAEKGAQAVLHIGKTQYIDPYLLSMLNAVSLPLYPNLKLLLSNMVSRELEHEVSVGRLDLAVIAGESTDPKITQLEIARTPFYILLADASPCAKKFELTLKDLDSLRWCLFERNIQPQLYEAILSAAKEDASTPCSLHNVATAEEAAHLIYAGISELAFLTKQGAWRVAQNGLTIRPLRDNRLWLTSQLIAREDNGSRLVSEFTRRFKKSLERAALLQLNLPLPNRPEGSAATPAGKPERSSS